MLQKTLKIATWIFLILLSIFVLAGGLLQIPSIQNKVVDRITKSLSQTLATEVTIDRVSIDFFNRAILQGVYLESQASDTLLFADKIQANFNLFSLLKRRIDINQVALNGTQIKFYRNEVDSTFNFQFLIDAFASDQPRDTSQKVRPWTFNLDRINIRSTSLRMLDEFARSDLDVTIGNFDVSVQTFDLAEKRIKLKRILLDQSSIRLSTLASEPDQQLMPISNTPNQVVSFPSIGWDLEVGTVSLEEDQFILENKNKIRTPNAVDFNHLNLEDITLELKDFQWLSDLIKVDIEDLNLLDHSGFRLNRLKGNLALKPDQTSIENLLIRTSQSNIEANFVALHDEFGDWVQNLEDQVRMQIDILPTSIAFQDLNYFAPSIKEIKQINTDLTRTIKINAQATGTLNRLEQINLNGSIANDLILRAKGSARFLTQPEKLSYDLRLQNLSTSYDKLINLSNDVEIPTGLDSLGQIQLKGQFQGGTNQITGNKIQLLTNTYTQFIGDFQANHLNDEQAISFNLDIQEVRTKAANLEGFVKNGLPPEVARLGEMQYSGKITGDVYNIKSEGTLQTEAGNLETDASINFTPDYTDANYRGRLSLEQFDLGHVLQDTTLGKVSFAVRGVGSGLNVDSLQAEVEGVVRSFEYKNYNYQNLEIDGFVQKQQFSGNASFADPNLNFNFQGKVNLNDSIPDLRFNASIDTINLQNLNFNTIPYAFSGEIVSNFNGSTLDNLDGSVRLNKIHLSNDTASIQTDSIILDARNIPTGKSLSLVSEFFQADIKGDYRLSDLPAILVNYVNDYFPVDQFLGAKDQPEELAIEPGMPKRLLPDQSFVAQISLDKPMPLLGLFIPNISNLDTANILLKLDTKAKKIAIQGAMPKLTIQGNTLSDLSVEMAGSPSLLKASIKAENIDYGLPSPLSSAQINLELGDDSLRVQVQAEETKADTSYVKIALGGQATVGTDNYRFVFDERFILNDANWKVDPKNEVFYRPNFVDVNNFKLQKDQQILSFKAQDQRRGQGLAPLILGFQNFELSEIFTLVDQADANYDGKINGMVTIRDYMDKLNYLADLTIKDIYLEGQEVGNLNIQAAQDGLAPTIDIKAGLGGPKGQFKTTGNYDLQDQTLALDAEMQQLKVKLIDPFLKGLIKDSKGSLSGQFKVKGKVSAPQVEGVLALDSVSTILSLSGIRYTMLKEEIRFQQEEVFFNQTKLIDKNGNQAILNGRVDFSKLNNVGLDLNLSTSRFQVLNTSLKDLALYYGKLFVSANVDIKGTANNPVLNMNARTLAQSQLFVQPLSVEQAVSGKKDFIIFAKPEDYLKGDSTQSLNQVYKVKRRGVDLSLNLEVTPEAELQIIIDPATGDKLVCRGSADMSVNMSPNGELDLLGNYRITNGSYALNYQGVLKRTFDISAGSRLDFVGDPLDTRFDVSAIYATQTPTFELIRNRITDENSAEALSAKQRKEVEVILRMQGDLDEPVLDFDIQIPESGNITNVSRQELQRLRENPSELNKQVFSLLLLNSFLSQQSGGGNLADAGTSVYLSSVSSLLSRQLNRLADNYIKGIDVNVGIDSYQSDYNLGANGNTITELNLGVSKGLFNDRLTLKVGGNVNVNSQNALLVEGASFSSIAGDFVLEYKLTPAGNYRLRVFRRDNYDVLNQDNTPQTGIGISFRKSFGNVNDKNASSPKKKQND
ncbi:MAG: hypothetical protein Sapg2KO_27830 [Saprospiraceae bacterium]